jgi:Domain of unknown function (DUF3303)
MMLFHIIYKITPEHRNTAQEQFKKTGGLPPSGVNMKGRWHSVDCNKGFLLVETNDIEAFGKWIQDCSDSLTFETTPILSDEQVAKVIR